MTPTSKLGGPEAPTARASLLLVLAVAAPLLALRLFTPYDLHETDQGKQAQYVLDVMQNGNWVAPGCLGVAATKPPLYTWLAAGVSRLAGTTDELTIRVPAILASLALVLVTWDVARRLAGTRVAAAAAIALATSHHFIRVCGVVRTDALLAFLLAAQMLFYVRSLDEAKMPPLDVALSSVLAAAGCLAKGPAGLLSCAAVAVHSFSTERGRRVWVAAGVPAVVGAVALGAWFVAASGTRSDVYDVMVEGEIVHHVAGGGALTYPFYYFYNTPLRLAPWLVLIVPGAWIAWRALRPRPLPPISPLASVAVSWIAVHLVTYSLIAHKRPDLIFPAEPAMMLLVGTLVEQRFPAWAPKALATAVVLAAAAILTPFVGTLFDVEVRGLLVPCAVAFLVAAAVATLLLARRDAAVACFVGLAAFGVVDAVGDTLGHAASVERESYLPFALEARAESARRGTPLVAVGFDKPAALFDMGISKHPPDTLDAAERPTLVVAPPALRAELERTVGPCEVVAKYTPPKDSKIALVLLATR